MTKNVLFFNANSKFFVIIISLLSITFATNPGYQPFH
jgi:hypothetical protein